MKEIGVEEADFDQIVKQCMEKRTEVSRMCHLSAEDVKDILYRAL